MRKCKVKLCGTTSIESAQIAVSADADFSGIVVDVPFSERSVSVKKAKEITAETAIPTVVLFFNRSIHFMMRAVDQIQPFAVQLLGHETPDQVIELKKSTNCQIWKSLFMPIGENARTDLKLFLGAMNRFISAGADAILFDTADLSGEKIRFGGTGKRSNWTVARQLIQRCSVPAFLSGGIGPENVLKAIEVVKPFGVDLCSGVEIGKGKRSKQKVLSLMSKVRSI